MENLELKNDIVLEMAQAGVLFGHKKSKTHPRMKKFIGANRNEIEILEPEATLNGISEAGKFLAGILRASGTVLVIGTTSASVGAVEEFAKTFKQPFVNSRWLGGTLTNFKVISERMKYYLDLKGQQERGELGKYTKKEQQEFGVQIGKMSKVFDGIINMSRLPHAILVVDTVEHETAVREAKRLKIPVVAILDTNDNPDNADCMICANDHSRESVDWVMAKLSENIKNENPIKND
jgi:small subunit ribosomal protein S2